jgi:hypothetical protein
MPGTTFICTTTYLVPRPGTPGVPNGAIPVFLNQTGWTGPAPHHRQRGWVQVKVMQQDGSETQGWVPQANIREGVDSSTPVTVVAPAIAAVPLPSSLGGTVLARTIHGLWFETDRHRQAILSLGASRYDLDFSRDVIVRDAIIGGIIFFSQ